MRRLFINKFLVRAALVVLVSAAGTLLHAADEDILVPEITKQNRQDAKKLVSDYLNAKTPQAREAAASKVAAASRATGTPAQEGLAVAVLLETQKRGREIKKVIKINQKVAAAPATAQDRLAQAATKYINLQEELKASANKPLAVVEELKAKAALARREVAEANVAQKRALVAAAPDVESGAVAVKKLKEAVADSMDVAARSSVGNRRASLGAKRVSIVLEKFPSEQAATGRQRSGSAPAAVRTASPEEGASPGSWRRATPLSKREQLVLFSRDLVAREAAQNRERERTLSLVAAVAAGAYDSSLTRAEKRQLRREWVAEVRAGNNVAAEISSIEIQLKASNKARLKFGNTSMGSKYYKWLDANPGLGMSAEGIKRLEARLAELKSGGDSEGGDSAQGRGKGLRAALDAIDQAKTTQKGVSENTTRSQLRQSQALAQAAAEAAGAGAAGAAQRNAARGQALRTSLANLRTSLSNSRVGVGLHNAGATLSAGASKFASLFKKPSGVGSSTQSATQARRAAAVSALNAQGRGETGFQRIKIMTGAQSTKAGMAKAAITQGAKEIQKNASAIGRDTVTNIKKVGSALKTAVTTAGRAVTSTAKAAAKAIAAGAKMFKNLSTIRRQNKAPGKK